MKRIAIILACAVLTAAGQNHQLRNPAWVAQLQRTSAEAGGVFLQNPTNLVGNFELLMPEMLGSQSDGYNATQWTNEPSALGPQMYSYGNPKLTNSALNGKAGVWSGDAANDPIIKEANFNFSNYMAVMVCRIDSAQVGDNRLFTFGQGLSLVIDPTRTNYVAVRLQTTTDSSYRFTNAFTRTVPFAFGIWRQGTNAVAWRETGQVGTTNSILAQEDGTTAFFGLMGNPLTLGAKPIGYNFTFLFNTNSAMDGTNLPNVIYFLTNKYAIHP